MKRYKKAIALAVVLGGLFWSSGPHSPAWATGETILFVTSAATNTVGVYRGTGADLKRVAAIPVGKGPHNLAISPDGKWVAVDNRRSADISIIDTAALTERIRIKTGKQPHDPLFSASSAFLYVGHELERYISEYRVETWEELRRFQVGFYQHDIAVAEDQSELWFTVAGPKYKQGDRRVGVVDLKAGKLAQMIDSGENAHDVIFSPDRSEAWVTNSGFLTVPSNVVNVIDIKRREVIANLRLGKYPFHAPKWGRDGNYVPPDAREMWFSDHGLRQVLIVDLKTRKVVGSIKVEAEPFHLSPTPDGILYVANHHSGTVSVIQMAARKLLGTIKVDKQPHGIVVLAPRPGR